MKKAVARSAKSDTRTAAADKRIPTGESRDRPQPIGGPPDAPDDREDGSTRAASEKLSGPFGVGNFVPSDLPESAREVLSRAAKQPIPLVQASLKLTGELVKI